MRERKDDIMKEKSKNIFKRLVTSLMVIVTVITSMFATSMPVLASSSTLVLDEQTEYTYIGVSPITGYSITHNIFILKMDGKKVFCVESEVPANSGDGTYQNPISVQRKNCYLKLPTMATLIQARPIMITRLRRS